MNKEKELKYVPITESEAYVTPINEILSTQKFYRLFREKLPSLTVEQKQRARLKLTPPITTIQIRKKV